MLAVLTSSLQLLTVCATAAIGQTISWWLNASSLYQHTLTCLDAVGILMIDSYGCRGWHFVIIGLAMLHWCMEAENYADTCTFLYIIICYVMFV